MGYDTDFSGEIAVTPKLPDDFVQRWNTAIEGTPGASYVSSSSREHGLHEPDMVPGFEHPNIRDWCNWELEQRADATAIQWNGREKFCQYAEWLKALVACILKEHPGSRFKGQIEWDGEERGDVGRLVMNGIEVKVSPGRIVYQ